MNITKYEFSTEDLALNAFEKAAIAVLWLLIQIPGNIMLVGLIQFDRLGGDPLKRRIQDQVRSKAIHIIYHILAINIRKLYLSLGKKDANLDGERILIEGILPQNL